MSIFKKSYRNIRSPWLKSLLLDLEAFLDQHYVFRSEMKYRGLFGRLKAFLDRGEAERREEKEAGPAWWEPPEASYSSPMAEALFDDVGKAREEHRRNNFSLVLLRHIEAKGKEPADIYKRANIDRKLFSKIKTNPDYLPSKKTALALALALELSLEDTEAFLRLAGHALSRSILSDVIIEFFITRKIYDLDAINAALYTYDQPVF